MDLMTFVSRIQTGNMLQAMVLDPRTQFGVPVRPYLGPSILPEILVPENMYKEQAIRYRTVIANDGSRYSPVQIKDSGDLIGEFSVELGHQDIGRELTGRDYDALVTFLRRSGATTDTPPMEATAQMINWVDHTIVRALVELNEKQRWDAIVNASVVRLGDNGYRETVSYPNPAGHRVAAAGAWSSDAYDPFDDISGMIDFLSDKGYYVDRLISSRKVTRILARNTNIAGRAGRTIVLGGGATTFVGRANDSDVNDMFVAEGIPPIETYDLRYNTSIGQSRFIPDDCMVFLCTTGRDMTLDWGEETLFLSNVFGYQAIGRAVGQDDPGRVVKMWAHDDKPPRIKAEGWQTSLPVLTEPEAIAVITGIS
jgi:hypothetical protein